MARISGQDAVSRRAGRRTRSCTRSPDCDRPSLTWVQQTGKTGATLTKRGMPVRYAVTGSRYGQSIRIVVEPGGEGIITAHPVP